MKTHRSTGFVGIRYIRMYVQSSLATSGLTPISRSRLPKTLTPALHRATLAMIPASFTVPARMRHAVTNLERAKCDDPLVDAPPPRLRPRPLPGHGALRRGGRAHVAL